MYRVDTKCILLNLLSKRKELTTEDLISYKLKSNSDIYFDISDDSVCFTVERNSSIFQWHGDNVKLSPNLDKKYFQRLKDSNNNLIPERIRSTVLACLQ